jgi:uncharacterized membrane protein
MKELIDPIAVEKALLFFAVAGPLVGVIIGIILGAHERRVLPTILAGALIGAIGSFIYGMWWIYNLITNALMLDSVLNIVLQLVMFAIAGALLAIAVSKISLFLKRLGAG